MVFSVAAVLPAVGTSKTETNSKDLQWEMERTSPLGRFHRR
jgi:hypothetical protein